MKKNNMVVGVILIAIGVMMMLSVLGIIKGFSVLLVIGAGFLAAYIMSKRPLGLLIPGCIISAVGINSILANNNIISNSDGEFFLIILGCAFFAIMLVHTMWIKTAKWGDRFWPVFPGGSLVLIGSFAIADKYGDYNILGIIFKYGWAVAVIIVGIVMLITAFTGCRKKNGPDSGQQP